MTLDDPDAAGLTGATGDHLPVRSGARRWRRDAATEQDDERAADQYLWLDERLERAGLTWYEVSNWARPGGESRHNQAYWRRLATVGVGPGAHGFDGGRRRTWNAARLDGYLSPSSPPPPTGGHSRPQLPPGGVEALDDGAIQLETVSLALRTREGLVTDRCLAPGGWRSTWRAGPGSSNRQAWSDQTDRTRAAACRRPGHRVRRLQRLRSVQHPQGPAIRARLEPRPGARSSRGRTGRERPT